jgi:hypothetical protein
VAGCSASPQSPYSPAVSAAQAPASALSSAPEVSKTAPLVFAADGGNRSGGGAVYAYLQSGKAQSPLWSIGAPLAEPSGLWVDGERNLYVSDSTGYVFAFTAPNAKGAPSGPSFTYDDTGLSPTAVALCGNYVYASNESGTLGTQSFTVWTKGTSAPLRVVSYTGGRGTGDSVTCDAATGNVYFAYQLDDNGDAEIDVWSAGGTGSPTKLPMEPLSVQGFALSKAGLLAVGNSYDPEGPAVDFYKQTGNQPTRRIIASWLSLPVGLAYEKNDANIWIADLDNQALYLANAASGKLINTITKPGFRSLLGVAVSPPDHP